MIFTITSISWRDTMPKKKYSELLKEAITILNQLDSDYESAKYNEANENNLTQDLLHELELGGYLYEERAKIATKLAKCRKDRRVYKDAMLELTPYHDFLQENKNIIHKLENVLGAIRNSEKEHQNRFYIPRTKIND